MRSRIAVISSTKIIFGIAVQKGRTEIYLVKRKKPLLEISSGNQCWNIELLFSMKEFFSDPTKE